MNRRDLLKFLPAVGAAVAIPAAMVGEVLPKEKSVDPIKLVRTCDGNWESREQYESACREAAYPLFSGCGTRFAWFAGMLSICPNCGYHYLTTLEDIKSGRFRPKG